MAYFPDELKEARERLRNVSRSAQEQSRGLTYLSERADHGVLYLDWLEKEGFPNVQGSSTSYSTASGTAFNNYLTEAAESLARSEIELSSASSSIQVVVSGSSTLATGLVSEIFTAVPVGKDPPELHLPVTDRGSLEATLDNSLTSFTGVEDLAQRRRGAWQTFYSGGEDRLAQAAHSIREILTTLLDDFSPNNAVMAAPWWTPVKDTHDGVSKAQKLQYFIIGVGDPSTIVGFGEVERQVAEAGKVHGSNIKFAHHRMSASEEAVRTEMTAMEDVIESLFELRDRYFQPPG